MLTLASASGACVTSLPMEIAHRQVVSKLLSRLGGVVGMAQNDSRVYLLDFRCWRPLKCSSTVSDSFAGLHITSLQNLPG